VRLLLLAGTAEARELAGRLAGVPGLALTASLAGATRQPAPLPCETRIGGFGGRAAFRAFLSERGFDAVIDATHPFAARMSHRAAETCRALGIAHLQILRRQWHPEPGDRWHECTAAADVAPLVAPGQLVFLATGRQLLADFGNLAHARLICRQIDPPDTPFPFPNGRFLTGRAPFSVADELRLFRALGVDWLVVKNSGGAASRPKLLAARALGLPVAMIRRPPQPDCARATDVAGALDWLRARGLIR